MDTENPDSPGPDETTRSWGGVVALLIDGSGWDRRRGVLRSSGMSGQPENAMGWMSLADRRGRMSPPVFAGVDPGESDDDEQVLRCWQDGDRLRIEDADGRVHLVTDGVALWDFPDPDEPPVLTVPERLVFRGSGTHLLTRLPIGQLLTEGLPRPTGPARATTAAGRDAWEIELAWPTRPDPLQLVVDAATGMVLQQRCDATGAADEWVELALDEPVDDDAFRWAGPVRTADDVAAAAQSAAAAAQEEERARWAGWFADEVTASALSVPVVVDLPVSWVHTFSRRTGAFEASLGKGALTASLARRPRSAKPWRLDWHGEHQYRWSTERWDWAVMPDDVTLDDAGLAALREQLGDRGAGGGAQSRSGSG